MCSQNNPTTEDISLKGSPDLTNGVSKDESGEYDFWGPRWYVFNTYWRLTLLSVQRQRSRGIWGLKLFLRDTLQHTSSFVKRFEYLAGTYHYAWTECTKSNGNIVVMTIKNTCYFRLDRVWNIHVETTENSISRFLDFNIFWGSNLPQQTPRGSRLWRSQYFLLLRNILAYQYEHPSSNPSYAPVS